MCNRAITLASLSRHQDALIGLDRALTLRPEHASALYLHGNSLAALSRLEEAIVSYERAATLGHRFAFGALALSGLLACKWETVAAVDNDLARQIEDGRSIISPFALLPFAIHPSQQLRSVQHFAQHEVAPNPKLDSSRPRRTRDKIRVAYMSADFGPQAVTYLITGLLEHHDRSRFEIVGVSIGLEQTSAVRTRVAKACDHFHELGAKGDAEMADLLNAMELDIIIDLTGFTENARPGVLARRPAPIQVSYLGYLGSMGVDFIDYVMADEHVVPFDQQPFYTEKSSTFPIVFSSTTTSWRFRRGRRRAARSDCLPKASCFVHSTIAISFARRFSLPGCDFSATFLEACCGCLPPTQTRRRICATRPPGLASIRVDWCLRRASISPTIWAASDWRICFSTRHPTTRARLGPASSGRESLF